MATKQATSDGPSPSSTAPIRIAVRNTSATLVTLSSSCRPIAIGIASSTDERGDRVGPDIHGLAGSAGAAGGVPSTRSGGTSITWMLMPPARLISRWVIEPNNRCRHCARSGFADDQVGDVVGAGVIDDGVRHVLAGDQHRLRPQPLRQPQRRHDAVLFGGRRPGCTPWSRR